MKDFDKALKSCPKSNKSPNLVTLIGFISQSENTDRKGK